MKNYTAIDMIIAAASQYEAVREEPPGSNAGQVVEAIQRYSGGKKGDPWCMFWISYIGHKTLRDDWPLPKTGSCDVLLDFARRNKLLVTIPARGDVFLILRTETDAVHTGLVIDVFPHGKFVTQEGNAAPQEKKSTREGYGVFSRTRGGIDDSTRYVFIRWVN